MVGTRWGSQRETSSGLLAVLTFFAFSQMTPALDFIKSPDQTKIKDPHPHPHPHPLPPSFANQTILVRFPFPLDFEEDGGERPKNSHGEYIINEGERGRGNEREGVELISRKSFGRDRFFDYCC